MNIQSIGALEIAVYVMVAASVALAGIAIVYALDCRPDRLAEIERKYRKIITDQYEDASTVILRLLDERDLTLADMQNIVASMQASIRKIENGGIYTTDK